MSGTRSHCQKAPAINPADCTLILGWYGSRNEADHARMDAHARDLKMLFGFASVSHIPLMLGVEAPLELPECKGRHVLVLPMFMCEGMALSEKLPAFLHLLREKLPEKTVIHSLPIIGTHHSLVELISNRAVENLEINPNDAQLLLVAHGSERNKGSFQATRLIRDRIRDMSVFGGVHDAYLEAVPDPVDVVSDIPGDCIVEGLFLTEGRHSTSDLSARIEIANSNRIVPCLGAVGVDSRFREVLSSAVSDGISPQQAA